MDNKHLKLFSFLCVVYLSFRWVQFFHEPRMQDFNVYYYSVKVDQADISPYDNEPLAEASGGQVKFRFVYPPYALPVLSPLTWAEPKTAMRIYLALKTVFFLGLLWVWFSWIPTERRTSAWAQILAMTAVGYYECVFRDFRHGNISTFEQFFLWAGIFFFCRGSYHLFSLLTVAASFFKLALIPFLGMLFFVPERKGWKALAVGMALFLGLQAFGYWEDPEDYLEFWRAASGLEETGPLNPSSLMFFKAIAKKLSLPVGAAKAVYIIVAAFLSFYFLKLTWPKRNEDGSGRRFDPLLLAVGYCLLYVLIMPRIKNYSFILLIFPTYWILNHTLALKEKAKWFFILLVMVHFFSYQSLFLAAVLFTLWARYLQRPHFRRDE